jgi:hypothetical protein
MNGDNNNGRDKRGLASASQATRQRVAHDGGVARGKQRKQRSRSGSQSSGRNE